MENRDWHQIEESANEVVESTVKSNSNNGNRGELGGGKDDGEEEVEEEMRQLRDTT